jgi:hypothetical protein
MQFTTSNLHQMLKNKCSIISTQGWGFQFSANCVPSGYVKMGMGQFLAKCCSKLFRFTLPLREKREPKHLFAFEVIMRKVYWKDTPIDVNQ